MRRQWRGRPAVYITPQSHAYRYLYPPPPVQSRCKWLHLMDEYHYKILLVGDPGTGKTNIVRRYVENRFSSEYKATIGVDFAIKVMQLNSKTTIRLQLWDIGGQDHARNLTRVYYKEADGAFVVFDSTRAHTLDGAKIWKKDLDSKIALADDQHLPTILLANKCDLTTDIAQKYQLDYYCQQEGYLKWYETSAKTNVGIKEAIKCLVQKIFDMNSGTMDPQVVLESIHLDSSSHSRDGACCF